MDVTYIVSIVNVYSKQPLYEVLKRSTIHNDDGTTETKEEVIASFVNLDDASTKAAQLREALKTEEKSTLS